MNLPDKITAAEIEQGINKDGCFPLCEEIATRYNEYESLVNRIAHLEGIIKEYSDKMIKLISG